MKIRTQLVLACFVLSVLPLTGIVLYSYHSSRNAVESAYTQEAQRLTRNMDRRLATIRAELDERLASLSAIQIPVTQGTEGSRSVAVDNIMTAIGDAAPLVEGLEFIPVRMAHRTAGAPAAPAPPDEDDSDEVPADVAAVAEPIVIDLPPVVMPRFEMTPLAHASMADISRLSAELAESANKMTREQRDEKKAQIKAKSDILEREVEASRKKFQEQMTAAQAQRNARRKRDEERRKAMRDRRVAAEATAVASVAPVVAAPPAAPPAPAPPPARRPVASVRPRSELSPAERTSLARKEKKATLVLGRHFNVSVEREGEVIGQLRAQLKADEVLRRVLGGQAGDRDEIPFAIDREGNVYTRNEAEKATLNGLGIPQRVKAGQSLRDIPHWIVVATRDEESGLRVGVARPVGQNLIELRQTAARNFGYGLGLIAFALIGMVPLANHFTRDVKRVTEGAERIARGDLQTRLPVKGSDEFGQLALAFNKMAEDLSDHQRRLFQEERARREQAVQQRVLALDYERKTVDLEEARRFQLSMLPKHVPQHEAFDIAVYTKTATEVGGDYYDFHPGHDGTLSVTIGDATGHGARAGTMVTVVKTLFSGYDGRESPAAFLSSAAEKIKRMELGRMAMALSLARFEPGQVTVATAGMPPMLVHRARSNDVEEIAINATPLGTLEIEYVERRVPIAPGDTILLMSDGFPELQNASGQQLGYPLSMQEFADAAASAPDADAVIASLAAAVSRWHGEQPPNDDITFVVVRAVA